MEPSEMRTWMWEFVWFKYSNARTAESDPNNQALARDMDFETREAKAFRAGWDAAVHIAGARLQQTFNELDVP